MEFARPRLVRTLRMSEWRNAVYLMKNQNLQRKDQKESKSIIVKSDYTLNIPYEFLVTQNKKAYYKELWEYKDGMWDIVYSHPIYQHI